MNLLEKFTTLRLESTESMVDYLIRAEYVSRQLELARVKVSENMLTSIVLKSLPSEYGYWKKFSKVLVSYKLRQLAMKLLLCYPKELLRKVPRVNLKSSLGSVGVAVKVDMNKPLVEYPSATFAGVLAMKRKKVSKKLSFEP